MNLEEIKKSAEGIKHSTWLVNEPSARASALWAADTILQLVAEVERINKVNWQKWNDNECDEVLIENEKLTAANKIMREGLEFASDHTNDSWEIRVRSKRKLAEADEVLK